ncbi:MAG: hypothetical protein H7Z41_18880 [Cytophagales bacterium]|nr:hypothetical protein [Armatimonadota bacterium]
MKPMPTPNRSLLAAAVALVLLFAGGSRTTAAPRGSSAHQTSDAKPAETKPAEEAGKSGEGEAEDKPSGNTRRKSQTALASKEATFAVIAATDKSVAEALKATDLEAAKKLSGKKGAFTGTVTKLFAPGGNNLVILNFALNYRNAITAVVRWRSFDVFPPLTSLENKKVLVTGTFTNYEGRPEIELTSLSQIKIVK